MRLDPLLAGGAVLLSTACVLTVMRVPGRVRRPDVLLVRDADGGARASCVVIRDGWALTAKHVSAATTVAGHRVLRRYDYPGGDVTILRVPGLQGSAVMGSPPVKFAPVTTYGWHRARVLLRTDGYQSPSPSWCSAPTTRGCSGGAVVDAGGRLVGLVSGVMLAPLFGVPGAYGVSPATRYTPLSPAVVKWIVECMK